MSMKINIQCKRCQNTYSLYTWNIDNGGELKFSCPHCFAHMEDDMQKMILQAALTLKGVNYEFRNRHAGMNDNDFLVSLEAVDIVAHNE